MLAAIPAALKTPDNVRPGARVAILINKFSPLALTCGASVVATGLGASVIRLPRLDALWTTPYGVVLLLKLVFVVFLFGAGAWNWRRMKPRLTGDDAIAPLRSSAWLELVLTMIVLGLTAILVVTELP
jgi:putative copper export protein